MFFFESHWNRLSRILPAFAYSVDRWAAEHGFYNDKPKEILERGKKNTEADMPV